MAEMSIYNQYLREVKMHKLLNFEQEIELSRKIKKGDKDALKSLINSNLRLVIKIARQYVVPTNRQMDIIQEGNIGLMTAAKKFSPEFNVRFASYAALWIKQAIGRYLSSDTSFIHLPSRKALLVKNIKRFRLEFKRMQGREPFVDEIKDNLNIEEKVIKQLYPYIYEKVDSLDATTNGKKEKRVSSLYDFLPSSEKENPEEVFLQKEVGIQLDKQLDILGPRDKDILKNRYCINQEHRVVPFHVLGEKYSISPESVRQIELRALKKLRANKDILITAVPV